MLSEKWRVVFITLKRPHLNDDHAGSLSIIIVADGSMVIWVVGASFIRMLSQLDESFINEGQNHLRLAKNG